MVGLMSLPVSAAVPATMSIVLLSVVLIACLKPGSAAYMFFTLEKVVFVGLISYSLSFWHWTVLSISRWTLDIHWWSAPIQVALMVLLAIGACRCVETSPRNLTWLTN
jgi:peptidoglycan/LPS O-acetylase OafA/YrhL